MPGPVVMVHGGAGRRAGVRQASGSVRAAEAAWRVLVGGGSALDAVTVAVAVMEDDPVFNAGTGSVLNARGAVEMDASVMEGTYRRAGAVGAVRRVRNPVHLARAVAERSGHVLLVGAGAETFGRRIGVEMVRPGALVTPSGRRRWEQWRRRARGAAAPGTVGAVARDAAGRLAAATSTGGILGKRPGRVGDSAVPGAGTYADDAAGAVSATGDGDAILRAGLARWVAVRLAEGGRPGQVVAAALRLLAERFGGSGGLIVVDRCGRLAAARTTPGMVIAYRRGRGAVVVRDAPAVPGCLV